jgi:hypothetical protein
MHWALVVEQNVGSGSTLRWDAEVLDYVSGTREQALAALWHHVQTFQPRHPMGVGRKRVLRHGDSYLVLNEGTMNEYPCKFTVYEFVWDSAAQ